MVDTDDSSIIDHDSNTIHILLDPKISNTSSTIISPNGRTSYIENCLEVSYYMNYIHHTRKYHSIVSYNMKLCVYIYIS